MYILLKIYTISGVIFWYFIGIDDLAPATSYTTTQRDGAVKLRMGEKGNQADKPVTLISVFKKTKERAPNQLALGKEYFI